MHRFNGPIRVIELLALFDEMHPSSHDADSRQGSKVLSFSLMSVYRQSLKHIDGEFVAVHAICTMQCHTGASYVCVMPGSIWAIIVSNCAAV